ncbi:hypothetical protein TrispH2_001805 [Trichoplax sp. H2]|nr:hypothetical protein TrispH2_001805 [Trichoplax sp. H2]|eukprot:RDD46005.1 hypothetical protein TrispH2_001805 [Trichoplax sp. H2]
MATSKPHYAYSYALSPLPQESVQIVGQPIMRPQSRPPPPPLPPPMNNAVILPVLQRREHGLRVNEGDRFLAYANPSGNNVYAKSQAHRLLPPTSVMIRPRYMPATIGSAPVVATPVAHQPMHHATGATSPSAYGYLTTVPRPQIYRPVINANTRIAMMPVNGQYTEAIRNGLGPSYAANSNPINPSNMVSQPQQQQQQQRLQSAPIMNNIVKEKNPPVRKKKIIRITDPKQGNKDVTEEILQSSYSSDGNN